MVLIIHTYFVLLISYRLQTWQHHYWSCCCSFWLGVATPPFRS